MTRVGFRMRIKPGCETIYQEKHDQIWPDLVEAIGNSGTTNYTIFREGLDLFAYLESDESRDPDEPHDEIVLEWWRMMEPYMEYNDDHTPRIWALTEIFHLD